MEKLEENIVNLGKKLSKLRENFGETLTIFQGELGKFWEISAKILGTLSQKLSKNKTNFTVN